MKKKFLVSLLFCLTLLPVFAEDDPTVLYNRGIDFYEQDKIQESMASFKKAISIDPEFYEAYYNLARIQESQGLTDDAIKSYEAILNIKSDDYESAFQLGEILYNNGKTEKAYAVLNRIPAGSPYKIKADNICEKIKAKENAISEEIKIKEEQKIKSSVVGNIPAPSGLVVDNFGNMYVASFSESKIIKISKDGLNKIVFADSQAGLSGPIGLSIDSYDNIYVANYSGGNVMKFDKKGKGTLLLYIKKPYCINLDELKGKIYITEQENNSVVSFDISDILKYSRAEERLNIETAAYRTDKKQESKVITVPIKDNVPLGTPSIIESSFTRQNPVTSITAPIMVPSASVFD